MNVYMSVLWKNMLMDRQPSEISHDTEEKTVKHLYDGTVVKS